MDGGTKTIWKKLEIKKNCSSNKTVTPLVITIFHDYRINS